jgi:hypothetical protein
VVCTLKGWVVVYLVSYRVDDIDMLGGRSDHLCERLCYCMVVAASDGNVSFNVIRRFNACQGQMTFHCYKHPL